MSVEIDTTARESRHHTRDRKQRFPIKKRSWAPIQSSSQLWTRANATRTVVRVPCHHHLGETLSCATNTHEFNFPLSFLAETVDIISVLIVL